MPPVVLWRLLLTALPPASRRTNRPSHHDDRRPRSFLTKKFFPSIRVSALVWAHLMLVLFCYLWISYSFLTFFLCSSIALNIIAASGCMIVNLSFSYLHLVDFVLFVSWTFAHSPLINGTRPKHSHTHLSFRSPSFSYPPPSSHFTICIRRDC